MEWYAVALEREERAAVVTSARRLVAGTSPDLTPTARGHPRRERERFKTRDAKEKTITTTTAATAGRGPEHHKILSQAAGSTSASRRRAASTSGAAVAAAATARRWAG